MCRAGEIQQSQCSLVALLCYELVGGVAGRCKHPPSERNATTTKRSYNLCSEMGMAVPQPRLAASSESLQQQDELQVPRDAVFCLPALSQLPCQAQCDVPHRCLPAVPVTFPSSTHRARLQWVTPGGKTPNPFPLPPSHPCHAPRQFAVPSTDQELPVLSGRSLYWKTWSKQQFLCREGVKGSALSLLLNELQRASELSN